jgi:hypothetical protein
MRSRSLPGSHAPAPSVGARLVLAGMLACLLLSGCARQATRQRTGETSDTLPARTPGAAGAPREIPFRLVDDQIVVPVRINGRLAVEMVLDTGFGSPGVVLLDPEIGRDLNLEYVQRMDLGGGGTGPQNTAHVAVGATLELGGVAFPNQPLLVLDDGRSHATWPVKGIIGATVMTHPVEIDYETNVLRILRAGSERLGERGEPFELTFVQGIPTARAVVVTAAGQELPVELLVDTGVNDPLLLRPATDPRLGVPERFIAGVAGIMGEGLAGGMRGSVGRVAKLRLGRFSLHDVVTIFVDETTMGTASALAGHGLLGNEVLERFTVLFDYAGKRMFLKPNARYEREFEFDMAGLVLQARGDGSFTVLDVIRESPAARAGVKGGDVLVGLDGKDVRTLPSEVLLSELRRPGREVEITLEREGAQFTCTVTLARLI